MVPIAKWEHSTFKADSDGIRYDGLAFVLVDEVLTRTWGIPYDAYLRVAPRTYISGLHSRHFFFNNCTFTASDGKQYIWKSWAMSMKIQARFPHKTPENTYQELVVWSIGRKQENHCLMISQRATSPKKLVSCSSSSSTGMKIYLTSLSVHSFNNAIQSSRADSSKLHVQLVWKAETEWKWEGNHPRQS